MGEESLRKRKGQDSRKEDGQSIQSEEPQTTNLQKQVSTNTHPPPTTCEGLSEGGSRDVSV